MLSHGLGGWCVGVALRARRETEGRKNLFLVSSGRLCSLRLRVAKWGMHTGYSYLLSSPTKRSSVCFWEGQAKSNNTYKPPALRKEVGTEIETSIGESARFPARITSKRVAEAGLTSPNLNLRFGVENTPQPASLRAAARRPPSARPADLMCL